MLEAPVPHKGPLMKSRTAYSCNTSPRQSLTNHSFTAQQSTRTTTASHTQIIDLKDSQASQASQDSHQRLRQGGKQRKDPPIPEKLESPGFLPPGSQIRKCKAGDLHKGIASLYYRCAWDGAGQKNILEFWVITVQLPAVYKDFSCSL